MIRETYFNTRHEIFNQKKSRITHIFLKCSRKNIFELQLCNKQSLNLSRQLVQIQMKGFPCLQKYWRTLFSFSKPLKLDLTADFHRQIVFLMCQRKNNEIMDFSSYLQSNRQQCTNQTPKANQSLYITVCWARIE